MTAGGELRIDDIDIADDLLGPAPVRRRGRSTASTPPPPPADDASAPPAAKATKSTSRPAKRAKDAKSTRPPQVPPPAPVVERGPSTSGLKPRRATPAVPIGTYLSGPVVSRLDRFINATGVTKRSAIETAIDEYLTSKGYPPDSP